MNKVSLSTRWLAWSRLYFRDLWVLAAGRDVRSRLLTHSAGAAGKPPYLQHFLLTFTLQPHPSPVWPAASHSNQVTSWSEAGSRPAAHCSIRHLETWRSNTQSSGTRYSTAGEIHTVRPGKSTHSTTVQIHTGI